MPEWLNPEHFELLWQRVIAFAPKLVGALVVVIAFWIASMVLRGMVRSGLRRAKVPDQVQKLVLRFVRYVLVVFALLTVADQLEIDVTSLVAGLGIAGLALSFAAQDTVENVISGIAIVMDRPFREGDWIAVGDLHASVTEIRLRTTVLTTFDNETVVVPNKMLAQERVVNYTLTERIRVRVPVGIAYKEDMESARAAMLGTVSGDDRILSEPAPTVVVKSLGSSSVDLEMRFWTQDPLMKYPLQWEYVEKCKRALDDQGIEIPFPHMQLFLERSEGVERLAQGRGAG